MFIFLISQICIGKKDAFLLAQMFRVSFRRPTNRARNFQRKWGINTSISLFRHGPPRVFAERIYFGIRAVAPGIENRRGRERETERRRDAEKRSLTCICSAIYHGLLFPIVGEVGILMYEKGQGESLKPCPIEFA